MSRVTNRGFLSVLSPLFAKPITDQLIFRNKWGKWFRPLEPHDKLKYPFWNLGKFSLNDKPMADGRWIDAIRRN